MLRLNNKDFTVVELERLISLVDDLVDKGRVVHLSELKELVKGTTIRNETQDKPFPILWNFKFQILMVPTLLKQEQTIKYAMRSTEVNTNIEKRFTAMCREEVNWFINGVDLFNIPGNDSTIEDKHD